MDHCTAETENYDILNMIESIMMGCSHKEAAWAFAALAGMHFTRRDIWRLASMLGQLS